MVNEPLNLSAESLLVAYCELERTSRSELLILPEAYVGELEMVSV
jgi:hypothetical protein